MIIKPRLVLLVCFILIFILACRVFSGFNPLTDLPIPTPTSLDSANPPNETEATGMDVSGLKLTFIATGWGVKGAGTEIFLMNPDGTGITSVSNARESDIDPVWSPDGKQIAFASKRDGNFEIYVMDANGSNQTRLTDNPARDGHPTWSPDGSQIAFQSNRDGDDEIYVMNVDGSNVRQLTDLPSEENYPSWSPDGTTILFSSFGGGRQAGVYAMDTDGGNVNLLAAGPLHSAVWSPDGKRIALDGEPGDCKFEIYIMDSNGSDLHAITSHPDSCSGYNKHPTWSPDGMQIVFWSSRGEMNVTNLYIIGVDGKGERQITDYEQTPDLFHGPHDPVWSPVL